MNKNYCINILKTFTKIKKGHISRAELAEYFEVSPKTISNYVKYLKENLNVDIRIKNKYYEIVHDGDLADILNKISLNGFNVWIILMVLFETQYLLPSKVNHIQTELLKLVNVKEKDKLIKFFSFNSDDKAFQKEPYHEDTLKKIYEALMNNQKLKIKYSPSNKDVKSYIITPLNIIFHSSYIYLIAYNANCEIRQFRLDRIKTLYLLDEHFLEENIDFDFNKYKKNTAHMYGGSDLTEIIVKVDNQASYLIDERMSLNHEIVSSDKNSVTYKITAYNADGVLIDLLGILKDKFEIIEPKYLREKVYNICNIICEKNKPN